MSNNNSNPDQTFIEQAEYLSPDDFLRWSAQHPREKEILKKLSLGGAKLITGPRGSGKTTLLLKAFHSMSGSDSTDSFPVYVNYKISLKLEPLYAGRASASFWFKQWLIAKIYIGIYDALQVAFPSVVISLSKPLEFFKALASELELGANFQSEQDPIELWMLADDIELILKATSKERCVLLLDDAAHAFSAQQQRDFFELFRQLKSRTVSPKAAIYPGVTYIPGFQFGHDAEEIDVWIDPYSSEYLKFMKDLIARRVPSEVFDALIRRPDYFDMACYASFGMPRALLNMIRNFYTSDGDSEEESSIRFSFKDAMGAIREGFHNTVSVFDSLKIKLPIYENFVECGKLMLDVIYGGIKAYNREKTRGMQSVTLALKEGSGHEIERVFGFYQYAGLMRYSGKVSRGEKGTFMLYRVHIAGLVENNALFAEKAINAADYVYALKHRNAHAFTRIGAHALLKGKSVENCLGLALPPCGKCGALRPSPEARFCASCGQPFKDASVFNSLSGRSIDLLPLTENRRANIKKHCSVRTVKDVLMDHEGKELRRVPQIGPVWAQRIQSYAEEFIS